MPQHDSVVHLRTHRPVMLRSDNIRSVSPDEHLRAIFEPLDLYGELPPLGARERTIPAAPDLSHANDDLPPGAAIASEYGGYIGIAIMVLVAAFIGAMLAVGGF